jgi:aminoglycoside 2'-N-acetyltransferase I
MLAGPRAAPRYSSHLEEPLTVHLTVHTTEALPPATRIEVLGLCRAAYEEDLDEYLADIGPGLHVLCRADGELVSHGMFVPRTLYAGQHLTLRSAYVELIATSPAAQRRGYASAVLRRLAQEMTNVDIGALSPSAEAFYERLGWETWSGSLVVRTATGTDNTPDETVMILRLPQTPATLDVRAPLAIDWRPGEVW